MMSILKKRRAFFLLFKLQIIKTFLVQNLTRTFQEMSYLFNLFNVI